MTDADFRELALGLPGVVEHAEMDHPDFRVGGRIFALLGHPDTGWGTVLLPPEECQRFAEADTEHFQPSEGEWGRQGGMSIYLAAAKHPQVREALIAAWRDKAPKRMRDHFHD
ncbi:MmcQ/YjbR family DNA-binding protein [Halomonas sp. BM-2019]|uniref:MmcQ/YjbR family DNA-binding protein n=1 Tax=Halomonas sp. BM-2019 TaxID=2811227 RepID=UPI001B3C2C14|nr:MAG: MmcQ/YjbR family DNA-binding protein [Halomonas sp. BM-2019]